MAIIDSAGLFLGDRLGWCSDVAQLHWPRLYSAANNFARLELNYRKIVSKAYANFQAPPAEQEFWEMIREYKNNFLLLVYQTDDGVLWGQWQTNERYLLGHKNADDRRSPAPPLETQDAYRNAYLDRKKSKSNKNVGLADLLGVVPTYLESCDLPVLTVAGVGVGEGVGGGKEKTLVDLDETEMRPETVLPPAPPDEKRQLKEAVERVFGFYCHKLSRNPKKYSLTDDRRSKAIARMRERIKVHDGDAKLAEADLAQAVENLAASDFHQAGGYIDWIDQIFKSEDEFQKRLNWAPPAGGKTNVRSKENERITTISQTSREALDILSGMDTPAYLGGGGTKARSAAGLFLEGAHGADMAKNGG